MKAIHHLHAEHLRKLIEVDLLTHQQAADILGVIKGTIQKWCKKYGLKSQKTGPRYSHPGSDNPRWKGGRSKYGRYWFVYAPDHPHRNRHNKVAEHRLIMEEKLGRLLLHGEVVHHIDGNPENNHPDNLQNFQTNAHHLRHELTGRVPNWSEDGKLRISAGVQKAAAINRRSIKSDDGLPLQPTDHQQE